VSTRAVETVIAAAVEVFVVPNREIGGQPRVLAHAAEEDVE
jgi:hypothetical protein